MEDMIMADIKKINDEALESVTGGARRIVANPDANYANVRSGPGTGYNRVYTLSNGVVVYTIDKVYSEADGYYWSQLDDGCWVASHLLS